MRTARAPIPGLPQPSIGAHLDHEQSRSRYDGKAEFYLGRIQTVTNVGTYIDSPFHRFRDGEDLAAVGLDRLAGLDGIVLETGPKAGRAISLVYTAVGHCRTGRAGEDGVGSALGDGRLRKGLPVPVREFR